MRVSPMVPWHMPNRWLCACVWILAYYIRLYLSDRRRAHLASPMARTATASCTALCTRRVRSICGTDAHWTELPGRPCGGPRAFRSPLRHAHPCAAQTAAVAASRRTERLCACDSPQPSLCFHRQRRLYIIIDIHRYS